VGLVDSTVRVAEDVATAGTATAGAVTGAVTGATVGAVLGAMRGAIRGAGSGLVSGARSETAAAVGLAAVGTAGLVEWPVVVAAGGGALILRQLRRTQVPLRPRGRVPASEHSERTSMAGQARGRGPAPAPVPAG
jgi:hypothetical protein